MLGWPFRLELLGGRSDWPLAAPIGSSAFVSGCFVCGLFAVAPAPAVLGRRTWIGISFAYVPRLSQKASHRRHCKRLAHLSAGASSRWGFLFPWRTDPRGRRSVADRDPGASPIRVHSSNKTQQPEIQDLVSIKTLFVSSLDSIVPGSTPSKSTNSAIRNQGFQ